MAQSGSHQEQFIANLPVTTKWKRYSKPAPECTFYFIISQITNAFPQSAARFGQVNNESELLPQYTQQDRWTDEDVPVCCQTKKVKSLLSCRPAWCVLFAVVELVLIFLIHYFSYRTQAYSRSPNTWELLNCCFPQRSCWSLSQHMQGPAKHRFYQETKTLFGQIIRFLQVV